MLDLGNFGATLSAFQITRPSSFGAYLSQNQPRTVTVSLSADF